MKVTSSLAIVGAALAPFASAFPAAVLEAVASDPVLAARAAEYESGKRQVSAGSAELVFENPPTFNAEAQYIDSRPNGPHKYVKPGPKDLRGPCPGLNAFANHGYLPHNGYATIQQFIDATTNVVGMGPGLAAFLAVFGAAVDGDGVSWSIGGTPPAGYGGPLSTKGNGISGSHNKYESDASPTRPDLYQAGNDYKTVPAQFQQLINVSPGGVVTMDSLTKHRSNRFDTQKRTNPYFFNGPFTGVAVQPAAYTFIYRFMANHTAANPRGILTYSTLKTWFGITGNSGSYVANQGQEQIPQNWYRRSQAAPYDQAYFVADLVAAGTLYPKFFDVGGNTGKPNSFVGVDIQNLTGGVYNAGSLAQGNNAACLAYQFAAQQKPDLALGTLDILTGAIGQVTSALSCPQLEAFDKNQLKQFPGYTRSNV